MLNRQAVRGFLAGAISTVLLLSCVDSHAERRCGYYSSSAPDDLLLMDKDDSWKIKSPKQQDGRDALGLGHLPAVNDPRYMFWHVDTQVGCACLNVETHAKTSTITKVYSGSGVSWKQCEADRALPKPD
ncbi:DUF4087 domain-containing protein [Paraburkholderia agricolaris]|jgi:hypothetical protein|uniref:DUF4087 domain-containing protein n=1 Tax=Paraburkholderia agricolaris TaxID=2152888 RepID=A0ABW8ZYY3_9BURK